MACVSSCSFCFFSDSLILSVTAVSSFSILFINLVSADLPLAMINLVVMRLLLRFRILLSLANWLGLRVVVDLEEQWI